MAAKKKKTRAKAAKRELSPRDRLFQGMAHPLRFQLLTLLNDREWSPTQLADEVAEGLSQVSYHVKVLKDFELIELTRTEPRRGAVEHFYKATMRSMIPMEVIEEMPKSGRQVILCDAMEEISADVAESMANGLYASRADSHIVRIPMILDEKGCEDGHVIGDDYIADMLKVAGEAATRLGESDDPKPMGVSVVLLAFRSEQAEKDKQPSGKQPPKRKKSPKKKPSRRKGS